MPAVPGSRIRLLADRPVRSDAEWVFYWMIAHRRTRWNASLERAVEWARRLAKPLVVLEALRSDYSWASDRLHRFAIDGMADNRAACDGRPAVTYHPYVEDARGAGRGLLAALTARAAVVVTDDYPAFFLPAMTEAVARRIAVRFEAVDANGLLPIRAAGRAFPTAHSFRRHLQHELPARLAERPAAEPLDALPALPAPTLPPDITRRWPAADRWIDGTRSLSTLPIDHAVPPVARRGGPAAADAALTAFLDESLDRYADDRNDIEQEATSGLSPYLHFGHLASWEVFDRVASRQAWVGTLPRKASGARAGWWGLSSGAEAFLDQLITWRELGFNTCAERDDYDRYSSLPDWAHRTLDAHAGDEREHVYSLDDFDEARTHDELWNAAQRQLRTEGRIHNYLRMLWGKKILEWSASPQDALDVMIELNNRYAIDGRDPNSWSGIFWCLGRYDRAWGPERPVFGTVRYMSSANTARKTRVEGYLRRFGASPALF